jgi:hypothetical protein
MNVITHRTLYRTTQRRVLLEKLEVVQMDKKFLAFRDPEGKLQCLQQPATGTYTVLTEQIPCPLALIIYDPF